MPLEDKAFCTEQYQAISKLSPLLISSQMFFWICFCSSEFLEDFNIPKELITTVA